MGEISEALRRARLERGEEPAAPGLSFVPTAPSVDLGAAPGRTEPGGIATRKPETHISRERGVEWKARATLVERVGPVAERWRQIALQARRALDACSESSLLVTSSSRGEGKTFTACNLALALASVAAGKPVALVDLDLRRPAVARSLGLEVDRGIEEALAGEAGLDEVCVPTDVGDLDVFPAKAPTREVHVLLASMRLGAMLRELKRRYALIVCDTPPVLPVPDVPLIAPFIGCCLIVTRAGITRQASLQETLTHIPGTTVIGTLLNDVKGQRSNRAYAYGDEGPAPRE